MGNRKYKLFTKESCPSPESLSGSGSTIHCPSTQELLCGCSVWDSSPCSGCTECIPRNASRLPGHLPRPAARTACPAWKGAWSPVCLAILTLLGITNTYLKKIAVFPLALVDSIRNPVSFLIHSDAAVGLGTNQQEYKAAFFHNFCHSVANEDGILSLSR